LLISSGTVAALYPDVAELEPRFIVVVHIVIVMLRLSELQAFMGQAEVKSEAFWQSVLQSDTRSLFPKHELAKIELSKSHLGKLRLMMDQLPLFLALPLHAHALHKITQGIQEKDVQRELQALTQDFELYQQTHVSSDYQFEVLEHKDKVECFCTEMVKPVLNTELR
jgi:hypothetical protein